MVSIRGAPGLLPLRDRFCFVCLVYFGFLCVSGQTARSGTKGFLPSASHPLSSPSPLPPDHRLTKTNAALLSVSRQALAGGCFCRALGILGASQALADWNL